MESASLEPVSGQKCRPKEEKEALHREWAYLKWHQGGRFPQPKFRCHSFTNFCSLKVTYDLSFSLSQ